MGSALSLLPIIYYTGLWNSIFRYIDVGEIFLKSFKPDSKILEKGEHRLPLANLDDTVFCKIAQGIPLREFDLFVKRLASHLHLPNKVERAILDGQFVNGVHRQSLQGFKFEKGKGGLFSWSHIITYKHDNLNIDLAFCFVRVMFFLSPKKIKEEFTKKFFFIPYYTETVNRCEQRDLSLEEKEHLEDFSRRKALREFHKEHKKIDSEVKYEQLEL